MFRNPVCEHACTSENLLVYRGAIVGRLWGTLTVEDMLAIPTCKNAFHPWYVNRKSQHATCRPIGSNAGESLTGHACFSHGHEAVQSHGNKEDQRRGMVMSKDTGCMMASSTWAFMQQSQAPQKPCKKHRGASHNGRGVSPGQS